MNFSIFFRLLCKTAVVGMEPVIIDPLAHAYSGFDCYVHTRKHARKKKKSVVVWPLTKAKRGRALEWVLFWWIILAGKLAATASLRSDFTFRIFCTNVDVARQKNILHEGKFLLNILTPLSYFFIQCRSFGFNNFFPLAADGVIGVCARKKKPQGKIQTLEPDCRLNRRW